MEKDRKDNYPKKLEKPLWSYRTKDGRGNEVFVGEKKAQEALEKGIFVKKKCKAGDLR